MIKNTIIRTAAVILAVAAAVSCGKSDAPALPYGSVSGIVTENGTTNPVPSATVSAILSYNNSAVANTMTDPDGNFTITDLIPGNYSLEVKANGFDDLVTDLKIIKDKAETVEIQLKAVKTVPYLSTTEPSSIGQTSVHAGGTVSSAGGTEITECGICFGTEPRPTVDNGKVTAPVTGESFAVEITGLTPNTLYYIRAYAINGTGTGYGEEKQFTTLDEPIVVS